MEYLDKLNRLINDYEEELIELRRDLHSHPELSHQEFRTSGLVKSYLLKLGFRIREVGPTGLIADLDNGPGKTLLLRAEMDALPIEERVETEYKSINEGVMHGCGHDVHTANLLIVAKVMVELRGHWQGRLRLAFQAAEERGGGAWELIEAGILDCSVDLALALHVMGLKKGLILLAPGPVLASSDGFLLKIFGRKAHSRAPEKGIDAINIASHIVVALNSILSREIDPLDRATFSIGTIEGGSASNVIADRVELRGIVRSLDGRARELIKANLEKISSGLARSFGGSAKLNYHQAYPSVINDEKMTTWLKGLFLDYSDFLYGGLEEEGDGFIGSSGLPILSADDFGFISQRLPSVYYIVGTGDRAPNHSSDFFIEEEYIKLCSRSMALAALEFLKRD